MAERLTARKRLEQMKQFAEEQRGTTRQSLRIATADANREARKEHAEHLKALAKLLAETGLSPYDVETLRPWLKDLANRLEQSAHDEDLHQGDVSISSEAFSPTRG